MCIKNGQGVLIQGQYIKYIIRKKCFLRIKSAQKKSYHFDVDFHIDRLELAGKGMNRGSFERV